MSAYLRALIGGFLISALLIAATVYVAHKADNRKVTAAIMQDVQSGASVFPSSWNRDTKTGIHTWADCLTLEIATTFRGDTASAFTRAEYVPNRTDLAMGEGGHPCDALSRKLGAPPPADDRADYWRYWWGSATVLQIVLGPLGASLHGYQAFLKLASYAAVLLVGMAAALRYRRNAVPLLPFIVALLFGFGLPLFGQSIADAPGFVVPMSMLALYIAAAIDRAVEPAQFMFAVILGAAVCFFELLDGENIAVLMAFLLVRLTAIRAFGSPAILWPARLRRWPVSASIAISILGFMSGIVSMVVLRIALRMILLHQTIFSLVEDWKNELTKYAVSNVKDRANVPLHAGMRQALKHCYEDIEVALFPYFGRHAVLALYLLGAIAYLAFAVWIARNRKHLDQPQKDFLLATVPLIVIVPVWYSLFMVHTMMHFWMTGRLLALFFALAPALVLMRVPKRTG